MSYEFLWPSYALAMRFNGAEGATVFPDVTGKTVTVAGNTRISTAQSVFGGSSGYFDGEGDYLTVAANAKFYFGTEDFTLAAWVYIAANSSADAAGNRGAGVVFNDSGSVASMEFLIKGNSATTGTGLQLGLTSGSYVSVSANTAISQSEWHLVEVSRVSGVAYFFLDGNLIGSSVFAYAVGNASTPLKIGGRTWNAAYNDYLNGHIGELVVLKGIGLHTASYTPSPTPFYYPTLADMTPQLLGEVTHLSAFSSPAISAHPLPAIAGSKNLYHGGPGSVIGTVKRKASPSNLPWVRRVRLFRDRDGVMVGETWSDAAGNYAFTHLDTAETYTALAYDHTGELESVCASNLPAVTP